MKTRSIKRISGEIDIEEIFLDRFSKDEKKRQGMEEMKIEVPLKKANFLLLLLLAATMLLTVLGFSFKFQILDHQKYDDLAQRNKFVFYHFNSERGIIYDRNMRQLVWNEATFDLFLDWPEAKTEKEKEKEEIIKEISFITGETVSSLNKKIAATVSSTPESAILANGILLKENLNNKDLVLLETKKDSLPYLKTKKRMLRRYENQGCLSHILGYVGKISSEEFKQLKENYDITDYIGKSGVEKFYDSTLREKKGTVQIEKTAKGAEISRTIIEYPQSGDSVVLTLDFALQKKIETTVSMVAQEVGSKRAVALALDPSNGEVLALVSLPCFDNNLFSGGISFDDFEKISKDPTNPQLNRSIAGLYPTGSTIKPFIGIAALEENLISEKTQIYCPSNLCVENEYSGEGECFPDWTFHGWSDIKRAIAESVNPFFYIIGGGYTAPKASSEFFDSKLPKTFEGLGVERIEKYLRLFGLGSLTGIDLPGEMEGRVPNPQWKEDYFKDKISQHWYLGDTYHLSIGQAFLLATPLQMGMAFNVLANGGKLFKPRVVKKIVRMNNVKEEFQPEIIRENFVSSETIEIIKKGMRQAVSSPSGSAFSLNSLSVPVAAKTGTAQPFSKKDIYHNWIVAFAPYQNSKIVLVVLVEEVAGPRIAAQRVAKEVLEWYFVRNSESNTILDSAANEDS